MTETVLKSRRPKRATRADVARRAGVSPAVVSYVVNGGPRPVAASTRLRVEAAIQALGYRPNAAARTLVSGNSQHIGLVAVDLTSPFYSELAAAIEKELMERGLSLVTASSAYRELDTHESPLSMLLGHNVTAAFMAANTVEADLRFAAMYDLPIVALNEQSPVEGLTSVMMDFVAGTEAAVEHLAQHGRKHIGFVGDISSADVRFPAWRRAVLRAGLTPGPSVLSDWSAEDGFRAGKWITDQEFRRSELDALFIASDAIATGCLAALRASGLRVPEDIAVVSFDGIRMAPFVEPGLTTVAQPIDKIAAMAVTALLDPSMHRKTFTVQPSLTIRRSCGC